MIPPKEACGHVVGHHNINGVVIMSQQDAEDTDCTQAPADPVIPPEPPWRICKKASLILSTFVYCIIMYFSVSMLLPFMPTRWPYQQITTIFRG